MTTASHSVCQQGTSFAAAYGTQVDGAIDVGVAADTVKMHVDDL